MTTTPTPSPEPALPREAYTLLAQANLLRMRGRWDEAVENCMAALRLTPENASAQSLLGDIYENQGRFDDAIQWYRMALDINPDSPADRLKLGRLLEAQQRPSSFAPQDKGIATAPFAPPAPIANRLRRPESLLRWGAWLIGLMTLALVILAGFAMAKTHRAVETFVKAPPITLPAPDATEPGQQDAPAPADPLEQALLQVLQQDAPLNAAGITPVGVQVDPRQSAVTVTILCPAAPAGTPARDSLLRDSLLALQAAIRVQGDRVSSWTVRCLLSQPSPGAAPALAFVADTTSSTVTAVGSSVPSPPPASQIQSSFHNLWWSPVLPQ